MPKRLRATASRVLGVVSVVCGLIAHTSGARAQSHDLPATLPDDEPARADGTYMPETIPDDQPARVEESSPLPIRFEASLTGALSVPLARNPDVAGIGFAATYGAGWGEIPLALGVDFISVGSIGDAESQVDVTLSGETQRADRNVNTRLLHFDAWLRLQPAHFWVRPYAEGFIGAQLFQGKYVVRVGNEQSERAQADDWGRNLGWGVGVEFVGLLNSAGSMSLVFGMRRVYGDAVKVARQVALGDELVQTRYQAGTSVLLFMVGIGMHYELGNPESSQ